MIKAGLARQSVVVNLTAEGGSGDTWKDLQ
jgi:hypothetical protein